jgi:ABC-type amino acid transport substrate-binding protein
VPIANAQQVPDPRLADLVQAGKIRVGLFLPQYIKDPATGEIKVVWVEIARALAARIGVQVVLLEHPIPPEAVACLKGGACDLLFLPFDARAANVGDFSPPIFQFDYTFWCRLAPRPAASPTQTGPGFASRLCAIMPRPLN